MSFPAGTVSLTETEIPEVDPSLSLTYWVGSPGQVTQPDTICAHLSDDQSSIFVYQPSGWVTYSMLWKSVSGRSLSTRQTDYGQIITLNYVDNGTWRVRDLSQGTFFLMALELSANGQQYFRNTTSYGWQVYDDGFTWRSLGLGTNLKCFPAFDGLSMCAVNHLDNTVTYLANGTRTTNEVTPFTHYPFAAVIGSSVIVGCASTIYSFQAGSALSVLSTVSGTVTGIYSDATSVWVGTDLPSTYMSLNGGRNWVQITKARAVAPWLVIQDGMFYIAEFTPDQAPPEIGRAHV